MKGKPVTADGYHVDLADDARRMCLMVATILGDLLDDIVVVGGLVPAENDGGNAQRQRWHRPGARISVDFLIGPVPGGPPPGKLQNLEHDFAAIVVESLPLAFLDCVDVRLDGLTSAGERAVRSVRVCGPAAFVAMKAFAFDGRGANKDVYDLVYLLRNFGPVPVTPAAERFRAIASRPEARRALRLLARDFASDAHVGATRYAEFLGDRGSDELRADAFGTVQAFLNAVAKPGADPH